MEARTFLEVLGVAERLKDATRHCYTSGGRLLRGGAICVLDALKRLNAGADLLLQVFNLGSSGLASFFYTCVFGSNQSIGILGVFLCGGIGFRASSFRKAVRSMSEEYHWGALYDLRLRMKNIVHINEYLYSEVETDSRKSGEKQFDYVDPKNRQVQVEMEKICTEHLKRIGACLPPDV